MNSDGESSQSSQASGTCSSSQASVSRDTVDNGIVLESVQQYHNYFMSIDVRKTSMSNGWHRGTYCKICTNIERDHYMNTGVRKCTSSKCNNKLSCISCPVSYRVEHCEVTGLYRIYQRGTEHATVPTHLVVQDKTRGIAFYYKEKIQELIKAGVASPKQIELALISKRVSYDATIAWPSGTQIQNYIREINRPHADNNVELGPVTNYLATISFDEKVGMDDVFEFNSVVATGSDANHLFIFMTTRKLMMQLKEYGNNSVNHIDGTCKITDRELPLLVFGFSDLSGQFFPVAFALVSHETGADFERFFSTLLALYKRLDIEYSPSHMMMDASSATYNGIRS